MWKMCKMWKLVIHCAQYWFTPLSILSSPQQFLSKWVYSGSTWLLEGLDMMDHQGFSMRNVANYEVWREKVNFKLEAFGFDVRKLVCEGCGKDPISTKLQQLNYQAKCVIYDNLHNAYLENIVDLTSAKDIWDELKIFYGWDNNNNKEKKRTKKKGFEKKCY